MLTLREWNALQPIQLCEEQIRRDIRNGKIYPPPQKYGRSYVFDESATRINIKNPPTQKSSLSGRIKHGRSQT
jgi:hypothetical protein